MSQMTVVHKKLEELTRWFREFRSCAVAFSGGVDSSLLAYSAKSALKERAIAITSISHAFARSELLAAKNAAREIGIELLIVEQNDLIDQNYVKNEVSRCYFCRTHLANVILPVVRSRGIEVWVDGTHTDDLKSPRPGIKALREAGFRAPFVELGISKKEIRAIARGIGLSNSERPSESCLASRIMYGRKISEEVLRRIERSEAYVRRVTGATVVRVRSIDGKALVEVDKPSIPAAKRRFSTIERRLESMGFDSVEIDQEGYFPGKMLQLFAKRDL